MAVTAALVGCGPGPDGRLSVSGDVRYDGEPVGVGRIVFRSLDAGGGAGAKVHEGRFRVPNDPGLAPGRYRVEITGKRPTGRTVIDDESGREEQEIEQYLPERYNRRTELEVTVDAQGKNDFPFELSSDG